MPPPPTKKRRISKLADSPFYALEKSLSASITKSRPVDFPGFAKQIDKPLTAATFLRHRQLRHTLDLLGFAYSLRKGLRQLLGGTNQIGSDDRQIAHNSGVDSAI